MEGDYEREDVEKSLQPETPHYPARPHYYGDIVRQALFAIGIIMIIGMPIFSDKISFSGFFIILGILGVNLFAGLTNPKQAVSIWGDFIISFLGLVFFELIAFFYYAAYHSVLDLYFWFNQVISILFFVSLYFSVKTLRGMLTGSIEEDN
ncbi:MAG: hypothetical protein PHS53_02205 [Candidatus Pacebacteria bacterium]|nr:hypothetical protein [Candidatus Paceibacterota bacterium]MDD5356938.1 hypothetical protein [Candidatus Paceibacterota bacterium]